MLAPVVELGTMQRLHITPKLLKETREKLGLNQTEAAARCLVTRRTWLDWENGHRAPQGPAIIAIEVLHAQANHAPASA